MIHEDFRRFQTTSNEMAMTTMQRPDDDESHERRTSPYEQNESLRAKPFDEENQISQETENDTTIQQG